MAFTDWDAADAIAALAPDVSESVAIAAMTVIREHVRSYTRGQGFDPTGEVVADDLRAVVTSWTLRYLNNVGGVAAETMGPLSVRYVDGGVTGPTLSERIVMDRWRVKAQ